MTTSAGDGFSPWSKKISHATEQLSSQATTTEAPALEPVLHDKRSHHSEKPAYHNSRVC